MPISVEQVSLPDEQQDCIGQQVIELVMDHNHGDVVGSVAVLLNVLASCLLVFASDETDFRHGLRLFHEQLDQLAWERWKSMHALRH